MVQWTWRGTLSASPVRDCCTLLASVLGSRAWHGAKAWLRVVLSQPVGNPRDVEHGVSLMHCLVSWADLDDDFVAIVSIAASKLQDERVSTCTRYAVIGLVRAVIRDRALELVGTPVFDTMMNTLSIQWTFSRRGDMIGATLKVREP